MSDLPASSPRPVGPAAVLAIFAGFALFFALAWVAYVPRRPASPQDSAAEKLPADQAWKATPQARKAYLLELRARQDQQLGSYGWVDEKAGTVRLPIDRAMDLVVSQYGPKP